MASDRKKPGVAFWATVMVIAVLVAYPLSFGPACWGFKCGAVSESQIRAIYSPIIDKETLIPPSIRPAIAWYSGPASYGHDMITFLNSAGRERALLTRLLQKADAVIEAKFREISGKTGN
jgi:hypothetical protein